jgi:hypothetical protein
MLFTISLLVVEDSHDSINFPFLCIWLIYNIEKSSHIYLQIFKLFSLINSCKSFNYSGLPSPSPLHPICTSLCQSQSLFCLDISPLIYLFVSSSSISPKFPLFNHIYIYTEKELIIHIDMVDLTYLVNFIS